MEEKAFKMGILISRLMDGLFGPNAFRLLMVGLDGAGKSTILYKLKLGEVVSTIPTLGEFQNPESRKFQYILRPSSLKSKVYLILKIRILIVETYAFRFQCGDGSIQEY